MLRSFVHLHVSEFLAFVYISQQGRLMGLRNKIIIVDIVIVNICYIFVDFDMTP